MFRNKQVYNLRDNKITIEHISDSYPLMMAKSNHNIIKTQKGKKYCVSRPNHLGLSLSIFAASNKNRI
jgi:hypothetical protein